MLHFVCQYCHLLSQIRKSLIFMETTKHAGDMSILYVETLQTYYNLRYFIVIRFEELFFPSDRHSLPVDRMLDLFLIMGVLKSDVLSELL